jgi:ABC-type branched-subunit amino acid transport system ATPase component/sugar phosphate permease
MAGEPPRSTSSVTHGGIADLTAGILEAEATRNASASEERTLIADNELPGVADEAITLREALRRGGRRTAIIASALAAIEIIDNTAFNVLAPDIQTSLHISDTVLGAIGGATGVLFVVGAIPMSSLSDRMPRRTLIAITMGFWAIIVAITGAVQNAFQMFVVRLGAGLGQSASLPVTNPLLIDAYPIQSRAKVFGLVGGAQSVGTIVAPFLAGGIATGVGGVAGWRWAFLLIGIGAVPVALLARTIPEPRRGQHEMQSVLGETLDDEQDALPISMSVAFERLRKIRSFYYFLVGMAALGLALFSTPLFLSLYFKDELGLDAFERGIVATITAVPALVAVLIAGKRADELFRRSPAAAMVFVGLLIASFGGTQVLAIWMPNIWSVVPILAISGALARSAFTVLPAVISTVIPYRLRARGTALVGIYVFLFGAFFGAIGTGLLSDAYGPRTALSVVVLPATLIGGLLIALGARHLRGDMAMVVEELREEREERDRMREIDAASPVIQIRNLDFSYGKVQVLFGIDLDIHRGETLALLGTNGAGKSTLLRVISGLGVADRGVVRLNGRSVTYADPELRVKVGIAQLRGGGATFAPLTVRENLLAAAFLYSKKDRDRRIAKALAPFPALRDRDDARAQDLSGGLQQMLGLAMALVHEPEVLIIDELSLGLAPIVVQQVLGVVRGLQEEGLTMIIVEQSLNVALSIADRAVFMEKGQIRFEGPATELMHRDDLVRAVFLGT